MTQLPKSTGGLAGSPKSCEMSTSLDVPSRRGARKGTRKSRGLSTSESLHQSPVSKASQASPLAKLMRPLDASDSLADTVIPSDMSDGALSESSDARPLNTNQTTTAAAVSLFDTGSPGKSTQYILLLCLAF